MPFRLPPGQEFAQLGSGYERAVLGVNVRLAELNGWYYFLVTGFATEFEAQAFIPRLYAGLMWAVLHQGLSPEVILEPQRMFYANDPVQAARNLSTSFDLQLERVDSLVDASRPAIYRSDKQIRVVTGGSVTVLQGFRPEQSLDLISQAVAFPNAERATADNKLRVALDLYNSFFREASANARFLTLAMALEALAPEEFKATEILALIDEWMAMVRTRMASLRSDSDEWFGYDSLVKELGFRREVSIRKKIRTLVRSTLTHQGDPDAEEVSARAVGIYDKRGKLVHDGFLPEQELSDVTTQLREIVRRVIEARFIEVTGR
jgi:hypothetical protein